MYCNPEYLTHYGFNQEDFEKICVLTTWAICGRRESKSSEKNNCDGDNKEVEDEEEDEEEAKDELKKSELEDGNENPDE